MIPQKKIKNMFGNLRRNIYALIQKFLYKMTPTKLSLGPFETRLAVKKAGIFLLVNNKHDK